MATLLHHQFPPEVLCQDQGILRGDRTNELPPWIQLVKVQRGGGGDFSVLDKRGPAVTDAGARRTVPLFPLTLLLAHGVVMREAG